MAKLAAQAVVGSRASTPVLLRRKRRKLRRVQEAAKRLLEKPTQARNGTAGVKRKRTLDTPVSGGVLFPRRAKLLPVTRSEFWCLEESLPEAAVDALYRLRLGGASATRRPTPAEELCRAKAVTGLKKTFASLCEKYNVKTGASHTFFDKWHCAWLHKANMEALQAGRLAPLEPLLPMLATSADFEGLDEALIKALAFVDRWKTAPLAEELRRAAIRVAKALPARLQQEAASSQPASSVRVSEKEGMVQLRLKTKAGGGESVQIAKAHYEKLRHLFRGGGDAEFADATFCCLLRYQSVLQKGFQGACTADVFAAFRETFGARFECFASPLNCRYDSMCSAFPDTDECFGSLGSFFAFRPARGSFQLNPPFVDDIIFAMVDRLDSLLQQATADGESLTFLVVVGANEGSRSGSAALASLRGNKHCVDSVACKKNEHRYCDGAQHSSGEVRLSPCDTAVFVLQSKLARVANPVTQEKMNRIKESFAK
eukprot:TRINITY_DN49497_c0_g1_i1.p1 TRINITY_DN49497_c0_g1~~TRINITY_DN49497_c0_g1_i1.p1  ORF type:complete len:485 (-),score=124.71 TRINITY_DN49497_c0_g1_i1:404-1858(-)